MTGIYARVSTAEQAKGYSIDEQNDRMKKFCEAHGWSFCFYTDAGYSGADTDRPSLRRLVSDVENKKVDRVLVFKLDRLSRSQKDTLNLIEDCFLKNGCDFVSMSESFDTSTPFGKAIIGILATFAQLEREVIKERMTMGKEARIRSGKWTGGITPFGYDYADGVLVVNEEEAQLVREFFDEYASGKPLYKIKEDFNHLGYRLRNNEWTIWSMRYMLENRVYIGFIRFNGNWIKGNHKPILDPKIFEKCAHIMDENRRRFRELGTPIGGNKKISTYLGGLVFCARCGNKFGKRQSGSQGYRHWTYVCYSRMKNVDSKMKDPTCRNKIWRMEELDELVFNEIRKLKIDKSYAPKRQKKAPPVEVELQKIDSQISRFLDLYGTGRFSYEQLDAKIKPLEEKREKLLEVKPTISEDEAELAVQSFDEVLASGDHQRIRAVVELLIEKIEIDGEDVTIYWRF